MKIVVLAGGTSTERAISIVSGAQVCQALREKGHLAILLDVFCGKEGLCAGEAFPETYDLEREIAYIHGFDHAIGEMQSGRRSFFGQGVLAACEAADIVFLALHGACGEDGRIQAAFDLLGIPYTGCGYFGSALAMDKSITKQIFLENGIPTPRCAILTKRGEQKTAGELGMRFPLVVKTACGGSSVGVYVVQNEEEFSRAVAEGFSYEERLLVEQYVKGRELTAAVVGGEAYPVVEIAPISGFYDYKNKYIPGNTAETCPARLSPEQTRAVQDCALSACRALRITGYARMDFILDETDGQLYCLEANTLPGMTPTSLLPQEAAALGMTFADLCEKLIAVSQRHVGAS